MSGDRGSVTLWMLGLSVALFFLGGLSLDLWRALSQRLELSAVADSAAVAGASGLDEAAWRAGQGLVLDAERVEYLAEQIILNVAPDAQRVVLTTPDGVVVRLSRDVDLTLMRIFLPGERPLRIEVEAIAQPVRAP